MVMGIWVGPCIPPIQYLIVAYPNLYPKDIKAYVYDIMLASDQMLHKGPAPVKILTSSCTSTTIPTSDFYFKFPACFSYHTL